MNLKKKSLSEQDSALWLSRINSENETLFINEFTEKGNIFAASVA